MNREALQAQLDDAAGHGLAAHEHAGAAEAAKNEMLQLVQKYQELEKVVEATRDAEKKALSAAQNQAELSDMQAGEQRYF